MLTRDRAASRYYNYYCSRCQANPPIADCPLYTSINGRTYPICPVCGDRRPIKTTISRKTKTAKRMRAIDAKRI